IPRAASESATANGMTPPAAIRPTGDEISKASLVMAPATSSSSSVTAVGGKAQCSTLAIANESQDFRDRGILPRQGLHLTQPFGKEAGPVNQLLIKRANGREPLAREFAALHADDVETLEDRILAVGEAERNHVAAHAADAADHHLRPDPGELMHRGQPADVNKISDLAMAAERCRGREDHIVADDTVMADVTVVHEVAAGADPCDTAALLCPEVHRRAFANGASLADLKPGRLAAIAQVLRRSSKCSKRVDHAAGRDPRLPGQAHMPEHPPIGARPYVH